MSSSSRAYLCGILCRPNLETGLTKAGILWIENDIGVQRIIWYAAGYEGQHDVTV
jgi:hypothetical protein